ncbi:MAG TPA: HAMP domain-containing sensor histidine kinase [Propionibacteriaceae bacterium]|nr:HAMP domain-containing sensor histidine kinase [Propionibacteriaceae bacterium]
MKDLLLITGLTLGACLVVGLLGALLLRAIRRSSLRYQLAVATLIPVIAVAATVVINVQLMFLSAHDTTVILLAVGIAVVLAVVGGWLVSRRFSLASRRLEDTVGLLVSDSQGVPASADQPHDSGGTDRHLPAELARVEKELAEARQTLADARQRERAAEQSRQELVSFMSHDLRTPLAGLRALAEGLEDGVIADVPGTLGHIRGTVARMTIMVDDLFALSRVQGAPEPRELSLVALAELVCDVTAEAEATAQTAHVRLELNVPEHDNLAVLGRHDDLSRALGNLVSNAIRHTEPGQTVRVSADRAEDGSVRVLVMDGCGGIPEANLDRVFDTGWRGSPARGSADGGAGLGLAIARGVVESHQGEIAVRNTEIGCCFEVALPQVNQSVLP